MHLKKSEKLFVLTFVLKSVLCYDIEFYYWLKRFSQKITIALVNL